MRLIIFLLLLPLTLFAADTLDIYWIDVEGRHADRDARGRDRFDGRRVAGF